MSDEMKRVLLLEVRIKKIAIYRRLQKLADMEQKLTSIYVKDKNGRYL